MCGRYASSRSAEDLVEEFDVLDPRIGEALPPSYNVAPTDRVYAVLERHDARQLRELRWGLVPSWAKDASIGSRMINARLETAAEKPAFRKAYAARRCLLPADGYYEWYDTELRTKAGKPVKQPFFITPADGSVLAMAGLYEIWRDRSRPEDDPEAFRWTCTVLTTEASDDLGRIHDRMPLAVPRDRRGAWLSPATSADHLDELVVPAQRSGLTAFPVSSAVGNVRNNDPGLVEPLPAERPEPVQETLL
ncbi:MAG: SOS response-associated peptidase [Nocardioidaceae bacterium]|nr:SOS response-associated peptidase [Nocardioidaceae bacterium]MCL2612728.1 SOS response-associated peptidase [Nocardioidaceae bacterium]